jgi:hypothetical protein
MMRWTNYFVHPGDNRYYVFSFKKKGEADDFAKRIAGEAFEAERHEEDGQWLFAINRKHFKRALRANHLVNAATRSPMIPVRGLRWGLLIFTASMILLAVAGALSTAWGQTDAPSPWSFAVGGQFQLVSPMLGAGALQESGDLLNLMWTPVAGGGFDASISRKWRNSWSIMTGLRTQRLRGKWALAFTDAPQGPGDEPVILRDTLTTRLSEYRIPLLLSTRIKLTESQWISAGGGVGFVVYPTDIFTSGAKLTDQVWSDFEVYVGRTAWLSVPVLAEIGWTYHRKPAESGVFIGAQWSRNLRNTVWGEAVWKRGLTQDDVRLWLSPTQVALVARWILPS